MDGAIFDLYVCDVLNLPDHAEIVALLVVARALWLLPDWLGKWQRLLATGRSGRRSR